mmetsp:Transcript_54067/g.126949  ORF Transcript_54067/g.126949 Transcript_54067/m.126949 type:complete len:279 (+) Transcript_54067:780-1616(+)
MLYLMKRGAVLESCTQRLRGQMKSEASIEPDPFTSIIWKSCSRSTSSISITRRRLWNSGSLRAPSISSSNVTRPLPSLSMRWNSFCRNFVSFSKSSSSSSARLSMSCWRASAKVSTTTATMRLSTPKTKVRREPIKMTAVSGCLKMMGVAIFPQPSPAMTVWKRSRFAWSTEEVETLQKPLLQSSKTPSLSICSTMGFTTSTINMAQTVITTKQKRNDHNSVLRQVDIMVTSLYSSRRARIFRSNRISRKILASLRALRRLIFCTSSLGVTCTRIDST